MEQFEGWTFPADYKKQTAEQPSSLGLSSKDSTSSPTTSTTATSTPSNDTLASKAANASSLFLPAIPMKPAVPSFLKDYPEWVKAREEVNANLNNITAWDNLIKLTETFLMIKPLNDNLQKLIRETFDELLARFPLFFGYWKKYVSVEYQLSGLEASISILSRSLDSFPNSLDLWIDYVSILIANRDLNDQNVVRQIRVVFEEGLKKIGYQFLSHTFWDKYINFEKELRTHPSVYEKNSKVFQIYAKVIQIPLHQYSRYLKEFSEIKQSFSASQLLEIDLELANFIKQRKPDYDVSKIKVSELKPLVDGYYNNIFKKTPAAVAARWKYESKFKPNYFNLVKLKDENLKNFEEYLKFEENNGSKQQVITLYERILVPTAFYEKFWIKYVKWMIKSHPYDQQSIKEIYSRAINTFLPLNKNQLRLSYVYYLEKIKQNEEASDTFLLYLRFFQHNQDLQNVIFTKYLAFLKRSRGVENFLSNAENVLTNYFKLQYKIGSNKTNEIASLEPSFAKIHHNLSDTLASLLVNQYIQTVWEVGVSSEQVVRNLFTTFATTEAIKSSTSFWVNYFNFEKLHKNYINIKKLINNLKVSTYLAPQFIDDLLDVYIEYLESNVGIIAKQAKGGIAVKDVYKEILSQKSDIQSQISFKYSHKLRLSADSQKNAKSEEAVIKQLAKSNGNIGFDLDERPLITNQLPLYENLTTTPKLPTFKNVEKANATVTYPATI